MASQPPNRKITEEQFVDGSTIDGTRIEKAFSDTIGKLNAVPKANLKQMMVPRMFYSGWQAGHFNPNPEIFMSDTAFPLGMNFSLYNSFSRDTEGNTGARTSVNNEWRWKGTQITNTFGNRFAMPAGSSLLGNNFNGSDVVGRTWSLFIEKPCIITDIAIIWERDNYTGLYKEPIYPETNATEPEIANANLKWWAECYLDSVFNADDKRKGSVLWRRVEAPIVIGEGFARQSDQRGVGMVPRNPLNLIDWFTDRSNRIPDEDFFPNAYQTAPVSSGESNHPLYESWWDKNLNILVPQQSRIHFGFGCAINVADPDDEIPTYADFDPYKFDRKFHLGYRYNIAVGFLESVEK